MPYLSRSVAGRAFLLSGTGLCTRSLTGIASFKPVYGDVLLDSECRLLELYPDGGPYIGAHLRAAVPHASSAKEALEDISETAESSETAEIAEASSGSSVRVELTGSELVILMALLIVSEHLVRLIYLLEFLCS